MKNRTGAKSGEKWRNFLYDTKEGLILNLAMLELADRKLSLSLDHYTVVTLVDAFHDQVGDAVFSNPCDKLNMAEILQNTRSARDQGDYIDLEYVLDEMVKLGNVFKQEEEHNKPITLQSALLAFGQSRSFQSQQEALVRTTT